MQTLHVGRGTSRGAMTVFPLWATTSGSCRYTTQTKHLDVTEVESGPDVGTLMVGNAGNRPALVLEGQLFEGGWQHRMSMKSLLVGVHQRISVEVACVEQGRWSGGRGQRTRGRRATPYVRDAARWSGDVQGEVWTRVARHTQGTDNPTQSFVEHLDRVGGGLADWSDLQPLPGQAGVLIGIGGQPYVAEVFDSPHTLRRQLGPILEAAALDSQLAPPVETPGRRARRFIDRCDALRLERVGARRSRRDRRGAARAVGVRRRDHPAVGRPRGPHPPVERAPPDAGGGMREELIMSSVDELIREIRAGRMPVEEAAPRIAALVAAATARNAADVEGLSRMDVAYMRMAGVLDEADDTDTFVEVEAAYALGHLSDEQYAVIRDAVVGGSR
ncbi:DUF6569 family protein [uncultured Nocardioides sp.]|uniref:ARPP-1 family domain-containing protein n=1 Tax=uncultured Nocardioides sp. TaxID=198441 RepID=UPI0026125EE3|nr:DUF6569 family protein [uncultured Nocardioides sp.]